MDIIRGNTVFGKKKNFDSCEFLTCNNSRSFWENGGQLHSKFISHYNDETMIGNNNKVKIQIMYKFGLYCSKMVYITDAFKCKRYLTQSKKSEMTLLSNSHFCNNL